MCSGLIMSADDKNALGVIAAKNKAIDEYFKMTLMGFAASGEGGRQPEVLVTTAMQIAIAAYEHRCQVLGATFCKKW